MTSRNASYIELIRSDRVSDKTREVLLKRAESARNDYEAQSVPKAQFAILRAVIALLIPQEGGENPIDIAKEFDTRRFERKGDGWRYATMPSDQVALTLGLDSLDASAQSTHGQAFLELSSAQQIDLLMRVQHGDASWLPLDSKLWFKDILAEATEIYVSYPSTLAAIGFSGIAFLPSWPEIGLNTTQPWEPVALQKAKG